MQSGSVSAAPPQTRAGHVLIVANYAANTGYAWDQIEGLFARIADFVAKRGVRTFVGYPTIDSPPRPLAGSAALAVVLDASLEDWASVRATCAFVRRENVRVVYLTDRTTCHWSYLLLRLAGVRRLVVHDRTSGSRLPPRGLRRLLKWILARVPGFSPDVIVAVSDFVAERLSQVALVPRARIVRVWNGHRVPESLAPRGEGRKRLGLPLDRPLVVCASRASPVKGIDHLMRAFDRMLGEAPDGARPMLVYLGDGPQLQALHDLRDSLASRADIHIAGYRRDAAEIVADADLCVVPSTWQDAFPNSVLEAMARGRAIIATRVGGIPEMIVDGVSGALVPPADEAALAAAMAKLIGDPALRERFGREARRRVASTFRPEDQMRRICALLETGLGSAVPPEARSA